MGGKIYPNGNYGSATDYVAFNPFSVVLVPNSTGIQTITVDVIAYGMVYGNGSITWGGYFGETNFDIVTF